MSQNDMFETREETLARRKQYTEKFLPYLIKLGAIKKSEGVYQIGDWFCYPSRCHCLNVRNKKNIGMYKFLKMHNIEVEE